MSANDRLQAMRERAAALKKGTQERPIESHFGITALDQLAAGRVVQRLPVALIAAEVRPALRQPRLLPTPDQLLVEGQPALAYAALTAALLELGHSLKEHQIQPIIVYPGTSEEYPAARYLILVGHRRWSAAQLVGLTELDAIVVEPPTPAERVSLQYAENEERADFTDMERAWALVQMKQALDDAPWEAVEERFHMSRSRRMELARLLAFEPEQQVVLARLRLRETQLRPLHQALRDKELPPDRVAAIVGRLELLGGQASPTASNAQQPAIDGPTIARLVAKEKRAHALGTATQPAPWVQALLVQIGRTKRSVGAARHRASGASDDEAALLRAAISDLATLLDEVAGTLPPQES